MANRERRSRFCPPRSQPAAATPIPPIPPASPPLLPSAGDLGASSSSSPPLLPSAGDLGASSSSSPRMSRLWRRNVCREVGGENGHSGPCSIVELAKRWGISAEDACRTEEDMEPTDEIIDYLLLLYLFSAPPEDLSTFCRIIFLIEEAHWVYLDDFQDRLKCLRRYDLKDFTELIFEKCSFLSCYISDFSTIFNNFNAYKSRITSCGAILIDSSQNECFLVMLERQSHWGFPKGKKSKNESDEECAIREVWEEVGYDISKNLSSKDVIVDHHDGKITKLYLIKDVPRDTKFETYTVGEIKAKEWHKIVDLKKINLFRKPVFWRGIMEFTGKNTSSPAGVAHRGPSRSESISWHSQARDRRDSGMVSSSQSTSTVAQRVENPRNSATNVLRAKGLSVERAKGIFGRMKGFKGIKGASNSLIATTVEFSTVQDAVNARAIAQGQGEHTEYGSSTIKQEPKERWRL